MKKTRLMTLLAFVSAVLLGSSAIALGPVSKAFAHTFSGDENAAFIAKTEELKGQIDLIQKNLSNHTLVTWHVDKSSEFWNANDTKEVSERNKRVANDVSAGLSTLFSEANKTNPDAAKVSQTASSLKDSIGEAVSVRIDPSVQQNATVIARAFRNVVGEALEDYGIAVGASASSGNNNNNKTTTSSTSTEAPVKIVNMAAYQTAQNLGTIAGNMLDKLKTLSTSSNATSAIGEIDKGLTSLQKNISDKTSLDDLKKAVASNIDPGLKSAYGLKIEAGES